VKEEKEVDRQNILDVLNSLEVVETNGGDEPYMIVENNEANRAKLNAVGVSDEIISKYADEEHFCILALAFGEGYADDFVNGKFVYSGRADRTKEVERQVSELLNKIATENKIKTSILSDYLIGRIEIVVD